MKNLLLLDADVAIHFHEISYWEAILKQYNVYLTSTVIEEIKYYEEESGRRVLIDLQPYIDNGQIIEVGTDSADQATVLRYLRVAELDEAIGDGELDCITVIYKELVEDLVLGIKDGVAIKSLAYLDLDEKSMCIEDILKHVGIIRQNQEVKYEFSKKKYQMLVREGKFLQVEKPLTKVN